MTTKKDLIIAILATFCLTMTLFVVIPTKSASTTDINPEYDPWYDLNDDGRIDILDLVSASHKYGATGMPINKTALLLELQAKIDSLNASLVELQSRVGDLETRTPKKGYISISPTAFTPHSEYETYAKLNEYLAGDGHFFAPLQLPNGSIITKITLGAYDIMSALFFEVWITLYRTTLIPLGRQIMASLTTGGYETPGFVTLYTTEINYATINNGNYTYSLQLDIIPEDFTKMAFYWAFIEYEYP